MAVPMTCGLDLGCWFGYIIGILNEAIVGALSDTYTGLITFIVSTPKPVSDTGSFTFGQPAPGYLNWTGIYDFYWGDMYLLSIVLIGFAIVVHFFAGTLRIFSTQYENSVLKNRIVLAFLWLHLGYPIIVLGLWAADGIALWIAPTDPATLGEAIGSWLSAALGAGAITAFLSLGIGFPLALITAFVYLVRWPLIAVWVIMQPLLAAFWVYDIGPTRTIASFAQRFTHFGVALVIMNIPAAAFLRASVLFINSDGPGILDGAGLATSAMFNIAFVIAMFVGALISPYIAFKSITPISSSVAARGASQVQHRLRNTSANRNRRYGNSNQDRESETYQPHSGTHNPARPRSPRDASHHPTSSVYGKGIGSERDAVWRPTRLSGASQVGSRSNQSEMATNGGKRTAELDEMNTQPEESQENSR